MKKNFLYITITIIALLIVICSIYAILDFSGNLYFKRMSYISPNNEYKIVIKGNGPKWSFGSENLKIYAYKNNFKGIFNKEIYKTEIGNDGSPLNDSNFDVLWEENVAFLSLIGEGNYEEKFKIIFNDKITIERIIE